MSQAANAPLVAPAGWDAALETVQARSPSPVDYLEVAAILESEGWTDARVAGELGVPDVFVAARRLHGELARGVRARPLLKARVQARPVPLRAWQVLMHFMRGMLFVAPMIISVASMFTLRYSLWSYLYLTLDAATAIAIGTILSFLVTGGFMQAIARWGLVYLGQRQFAAARRVSYLLVRWGFVASILVGLALFLVNMVFTVLPTRLFWLVLTYYSFLSFIWLNLTVLYMLRRELLFSAITVAAIAGVFVLHELLRWDIIAAQMAGLSVGGVLSFVSGMWLLRRGERAPDGGLASIQLPRLSLIAYAVAPYFAYGVIYFAFLFADRILAWSANSIYMPYQVWFRGEYELGLDWAILSLVLPMGAVEVLVNLFAENLGQRQQEFSVTQVGDLARHFLRRYHWHLALYAVAAMTSGLVVALMVQVIDRHVPDTLRILSSPTTRFVFAWAVVGYVITAVALFNTLMLFSLSQASDVLRAIGMALAVNLLLGFALSRWVDYSWAIFGLVAGAAVFFALTMTAVRRALGRLDYHAYGMV